MRKVHQEVALIKQSMEGKRKIEHSWLLVKNGDQSRKQSEGVFTVQDCAGQITVILLQISMSIKIS